MSRKHALLGASSASRWMNCTPSAVLESKVKERHTTFTDEGTVAHDLAELMLRYELNAISKEEYKKGLKEIEENEHYSDSMNEYVNDYVVYCLEKYNTYNPAPFYFIEERLELNEFIPFGFGHSDFGIVSPYVLELMDLKFGKGVPVIAEGNKQAMVYALGAYSRYKFMSDIQIVRLHIFQPRIGNITSWEISIEHLLQWANEELKPKAQIAYEGKGELKAGPWCQFCKVKATCREFAKVQLNLAKLDFEDLLDLENTEGTLKKSRVSSYLTDEELAGIVKGAEVFKSWINGVLEYALQQALQGKQWPGLKVVHGRSVRRYSDAEKIIEVLKNNGYSTEDITRKKLIPITEMEKILGKHKLTELIGKYVVKPEGGPSLVTTEDMRPEYNKTESAKKDFENLI